MKHKKKNEEFIKTSLALRDEGLKAENNIVQQKTKKIIKDVIDPAPGLLKNDTFNQQEDTNIDTQKYTDTTYKLKPDVPKQLTLFYKTLHRRLLLNQYLHLLSKILITKNYLQLKTFLLTMR